MTNASLLARLFAAGDAGDLDAFVQFLHDDIVVPAPAGLSTRGLDSEKESWRRARAAMPGLHHEFVDVLTTFFPFLAPANCLSNKSSQVPFHFYQRGFMDIHHVTGLIIPHFHSFFVRTVEH